MKKLSPEKLADLLVDHDETVLKTVFAVLQALDDQPDEDPNAELNKLKTNQK